MTISPRETCHVEAAQPPLVKTYRTIVVDPPWDYATDKGFNGYRGDPVYQVAPDYSLMSLAALTEFGDTVRRMMDPVGCSLFMWTTTAFLFDAYQLCRAWGMEREVGFWVWIKSEAGMGMGRWQRNDTEYVIWAVRGAVPPPERAETNTFRGARRAHSVKPASFYDKIERVSPPPYMDLFGGRGTLRFGWDAWGDGK